MNEIKITIFAKEDCSFCDMAKSLFRQFAYEFKLKVEVVDINTPEGEEGILKYGFLFAPGILINDLPFSYGRPSERKIRQKLLNLTNNG